MERETKTIETPVDKHSVVIKLWVTGEEKRKIRSPFMEAMKISTNGESELSKLSSDDLLNRVENLLIETIIVSVDGKTIDIVKEVLEMKGDDYDFVLSEINKINIGKNFKMP
jgi:hypothetical protein